VQPFFKYLCLVFREIDNTRSKGKLDFDECFSAIVHQVLDLCEVRGEFRSYFMWRELFKSLTAKRGVPFLNKCEQLREEDALTLEGPKEQMDLQLNPQILICLFGKFEPMKRVCVL
jgi:hypothetical protein